MPSARRHPRDTVLTAEDDPIIPADDFHAFPKTEMLRTLIQPHGGHVGYMDLWPLHHRLPSLILSLLDESA